MADNKVHTASMTEVSELASRVNHVLIKEFPRSTTSVTKLATAMAWWLGTVAATDGDGVVGEFLDVMITAVAQTKRAMEAAKPTPPAAAPAK